MDDLRSVNIFMANNECQSCGSDCCTPLSEIAADQVVTPETVSQIAEILKPFMIETGRTNIVEAVYWLMNDRDRLKAKEEWRMGWR